MIYDSINHLDCYAALSDNMRTAVQTIQEMNFDALEAGRYNVDGENVYFMIQEPALRKAEESQFEAHRRYLDIQFALQDGESFGYLPIETIANWEDYSDEKDIVFSETDEKGLCLPLNRGMFVVFYPQDAHMPCLGADDAGSIRKVVFKVRL